MVLLLLTLLIPGLAQAEFALPQGQWFDALRDGHGIDLQPIGPGRYILIIYTYDDDGEPVWYLASATVDGDTLQGEFGAFNYDANASPPQQQTAVVGSFTLTEGATDACSGRPDSAATFAWTLFEESGVWCMSSLLNPQRPVTTDYTAMWYAGEGDTGWGVSLGMQRQAAAANSPEVWVALIFYYNAAGEARWAQAVGNPAAGPLPLNNYRGYCRLCESAPVEVAPAGQLAIALGSERGWPVGEVDMTLDYALGEGNWDRPDTAIEMLTDPLPGFAELPDELADSETIAFLDVELVDMRDDPQVLSRQSVLVSDGIIQQVGPYRSFPLPADVWRVHAPGQYLGPGLTEMHLHVTVGGMAAARDAGTMLLANGVTTVMNLGDPLIIDLADLRTRFNDGRWFGPNFYLANVAYGPGDNANPTNTVSSPAQATTYATQLQALGYDYLKVYWQVSPAVFSQFALEGQLRNMPLIGHIPQTQPMATSLQGGQRLAVHVQEPFYSYMQGQMNPGLIAGAADVFLANGTYMSPTLAVFESYFGVFGGNQAAFDEFTTRQGVEFTHPTIRTLWVNYFNGPGIQGNGQVVGGLDQLKDLFWQIAREFHQRGVPMLVGTDAPGFPGVMSGYGVHEELRLLTEVGLTPAEAYAAGSRNAGQFLEDTLGDVTELGPNIGVVEPGRRADLLLLDRDPLVDVAHLREPAVVVSRGRLFSRTFLDQALQIMADRYQASKAQPIDHRELGPLYCTNHIRWQVHQRLKPPE